MKTKLKLLAFSFLVTLSLSKASAQITVPSNGVVCLNDLAHLSYTPPSGKTVSSYQWAFGDGYTSQAASPFHLYKKSGKFTISLLVTFNGGGSSSAQAQIEVLPLPTALFDVDANNTLCQYTSLKIMDKSKPVNSNRPITERNIIWGDGARTNDKSPYGSTRTHYYSRAGTFDVELEVIDKMGCKASVKKQVKMKRAVKAKMDYDIDNSQCDKSIVCLENKTSDPTKAVQSYYWRLDDLTSSKDHFTTKFCKTFTQTQWVNATLIVTSKDGCIDSVSHSIEAKVDKTTHVLTLGKSEVCYGEKRLSVSINEYSSTPITWRVGTQQLKSRGRTTYINFDQLELEPKRYTVTASMNKNGCKKTYSKNFKIIGPKARPTIFNQSQCGPNRKVLFVADLDSGHNPKYDYKWIVRDPDGSKCTINREKNINKYKNCDTTIGWFGKHMFSSYDQFPIWLTVSDPESGCSDTRLKYIFTNACGSCRPLDGPIAVCSGDWFLSTTRKSGDPKWFSYDNGKNWLKYPSQLPDSLSGTYDLSLIYHFTPPTWAEDWGDDSIRIHKSPFTFIDTVHFKDALYVDPGKKDDVSLQMSAQCKPTKVWLKLKKGEFKAGEQARINWGDGQFTNLYFSRDTTIHIFEHTYNEVGGDGEVELVMMTKLRCKTTYKFPYKFGYTHELIGSANRCVDVKSCFRLLVKDYSSGRVWSNHGDDGTVNWYVNEKRVNTGKFEHCETFDSTGSYSLRAVVRDHRGCRDTMDTTVLVNRVWAGVTQQSMLHYCSGQRQFFDSSSSLYPISDPIQKYRWDGGTGWFSGTLKNPVYSFDGTKNVVTIRHVAISKHGCTDTMSFDLRVIKSHPRIDLSDSVGCEAFTATFKNISTGATHYIWEMGDVNNTTVQRTDTSEVTFTYPKAGRYYINLIGIDSFYNRVNQQVYYCYTKYPSQFQKPVTVVVLPTEHAGLIGPDTLCVEEKGTFKSLSTDQIDYDHWRIDGQTPFKLAPQSSIQRSFADTGRHFINLHPFYLGHPVTPKCISRIEKEVYVQSVKADFEIDTLSREPNFHFINKSEPTRATYHWDFGHPNSGADNHSTETHPWHNYGRDNGQFQVCLIASLSPTCQDHICKPIENYFNQAIELYNVFSPGTDGKNDTYDVILEGESYHELYIYNRWGELVYESKSDKDQLETIRWNGRVFNKGADCPEGAYFYVLKYAFAAEPGEIHEASGTVTLIRD